MRGRREISILAAGLFAAACGPVMGAATIYDANGLLSPVQDGWTIGVVNYARDLRGVQIGLINIARSNPKGTRVLPLFNADFRN